MTELESLALANKIVSQYGMTAEFLENAYSVGVGGDCRTYTRAIVLIGPHPGNEILGSLATNIGNLTGINRITIELTASNMHLLVEKASGES